MRCIMKTLLLLLAARAAARAAVPFEEIGGVRVERGGKHGYKHVRGHFQHHLRAHSTHTQYAMRKAAQNAGSILRAGFLGAHTQYAMRTHPQNLCLASAKGCEQRCTKYADAPSDTHLSIRCVNRS